MLKRGLIYIICCLLGSCLQKQERKDYQVQERESANFSVLSPELYPEERLIVKINGDVVLEEGNEASFDTAFWKHFLYPDSIRIVEVTTFYKGEKKIEKVYRDTLKYANRRSVLISRTFPKGMTKENYEQFSFVAMDSADRKITLVDDSVHYKDAWFD